MTRALYSARRRQGGVLGLGGRGFRRGLAYGASTLVITLLGIWLQR
ncbi:hypothetical protein ACIPPN_27075 [Streptomyces diastaticus]|nr:hypothetical protein [Streptomyces diastaticus]